MGFMSTCQKETTACTILLNEVSMCLTETISTIFNTVNGNKCQMLSIQARRLFIESSGILFFNSARQNILILSKR